MATDRVQSALLRIEAALDRIEARPAPVAADPELAVRHERLRTRAAAALARLDRLLDTGTAD